MSSKYFNIANDLEDKIPTFLKEYNGKLPSESKLCQLYGVSRQTIRSALSLLIRENYITSLPGSGYRLTGKLPTNNNRIALLLPSLEQYLYPSLISTLSSELKSKGFELETHPTGNLYHLEKNILDMLSLNPPRMIIVEGISTALPNPNIDIYRTLQENGCPILFIKSPYSDEFFSLSQDCCAEGEYAVEILHKLGHRKIAGIFPGFNQSGIDMYRGWLSAQWQLDNIAEPIYTFYGDKELNLLRKQQDFSFFTSWIKSYLLDSTAIVCYNDEIAYWIIKALNNVGFSCPEDISVTGADGSYLAKLSSPIISTFSISQSNYANNIGNYISSILSGSLEKNCIIKRSFQDCPSISRIAPLTL